MDVCGKRKYPRVERANSLGALLAIMPQIVDAPDVCQGAFGLSRVADQQFGGARWRSGAACLTWGALVLLVRLLWEQGRCDDVAL